MKQYPTSSRSAVTSASDRRSCCSAFETGILKRPVETVQNGACNAHGRSTNIERIRGWAEQLDALSACAGLRRKRLRELYTFTCKTSTRVWTIFSGIIQGVTLWNKNHYLRENAAAQYTDPRSLATVLAGSAASIDIAVYILPQEQSVPMASARLPLRFLPFAIG